MPPHGPLSDTNRAGEHFRLAVEAAGNAMVMVDHEGRIVLVNSRTEELFGYDRQELIGQSIEILVPESSRKNHPGLRGQYLKHAEARSMSVGRDVHAQHKDGRQFPVEIGLNPIETEEGTWVLSSIVDITERKRAESTLRESEARFRNMADTAPVMVWVSGPDKSCTFFNKAWLDFTGRTMEQELGSGWVAGVHPDDVDGCVATYTESFDARRSFQMEYRLRRADGAYRWVLDDGAPRFGLEGAFAGYVGSCIDVTETRRSQEEAVMSQKLESVGQLARGIAHDFNNLLGGILATAELALSERKPGWFPEQELLSIRQTAERGGEIVRQLMTYSGEQSPDFAMVDVSSLIEEMLQLLKVLISKHAVIETDLESGLPAVHGNPAQIRQVVMNLVTNASDAIGDSRGTIGIAITGVTVEPAERATGAAASPSGNCLKLVVSDTGSGMPPEIQRRIFDPFFTTKSNGRGLGLAVVQGIVRSHRGAVRVVSSVNGGTRFEVLFPCTQQRATVVSELAAAPMAVRGTHLSGTVLVVEDEDILRVPVSKILRRTGLTVIEAADGYHAVKLFRENAGTITAVLLDMTLPGMKGPEVFAEMVRIQPATRIILTTAYSEEMVAASLGGQQAWAFIRKPYRVGDLLALLQDAYRQDRDSSGHASV